MASLELRNFQPSVGEPVGTARDMAFSHHVRSSWGHCKNEIEQWLSQRSGAGPLLYKCKVILGV